MIGTLIGMKSMDEGKHDLICLICRVLTSYKPPTLQPGSITEKVSSSSLLSVKRGELEISQPQRRVLTTTLWDLIDAALLVNSLLFFDSNNI